MPIEFVIMYVIVDVFCFIFSLVIFSKIPIDMGTEREVRAIRRLIVSFALYLVADAIWALGVYGVLPLSEIATGLIESLTMFIAGFIAYFWFVYAENRLRAPYVNYRFFTQIAAIPIVAVALLYATSYFTGFVFVIGPDGTYANGPLQLLLAIAFLFYVFYTAVHALACCVREKSSIRRREDLSYVWFAIPPLVFGVLDVLVHGMPSIAISVFSSILLVFMTSQDLRINTDALTGLNNRRRATEYIEDCLDELSDDRFVVFIIDADYFKEINDTFGHAGGDRALQLIADGLRRAMDGHHGLAARWGGDEFLAAVFVAPEQSIDDVKRSINDAIAVACENSDEGQVVSVSIGAAVAHRGDTVVSLVAEADRALYAEKAAHHASVARRSRA